MLIILDVDKFEEERPMHCLGSSFMHELEIDPRAVKTL